MSDRKPCVCIFEGPHAPIQECSHHAALRTKLRKAEAVVEAAAAPRDDFAKWIITLDARVRQYRSQDDSTEYKGAARSEDAPGARGTPCKGARPDEVPGAQDDSEAGEGDG